MPRKSPIKVDKRTPSRSTRRSTPFPYGLGRCQKTDPRDHLYALAAPVRLPTITKKTWTVGASQPFDQGRTSQCVSYSTNGYLVSSPIRNKMPMSFGDFYKECQRNDEWPGENYDGTSVRGAFKVLMQLGYVDGYNWAFDVPTVLNQILTVSPVVMGTDWTNDMFEPVSGGAFAGFIRVAPTGNYKPIGGHAWEIIGADRKKKCPDLSVGAFQMINSWGKSWGANGRAWISFQDLGLLLNNKGEAAVANEVYKKPLPSKIAA